MWSLELGTMLLGIGKKKDLKYNWIGAQPCSWNFLYVVITLFGSLPFIPTLFLQCSQNNQAVLESPTTYEPSASVHCLWMVQLTKKAQPRTSQLEEECLLPSCIQASC